MPREIPKYWGLVIPNHQVSRVPELMCTVGSLGTAEECPWYFVVLMVEKVQNTP